MKIEQIKWLEKIITEANIEYRKGTPIISDKDYDIYFNKLKQLDPDNLLVLKSRPSNPPELTRKEKLPIPMFSLEKVHSIEEVLKWIKNKNLPLNTLLCITPKLDGISLLVKNLEKLAWTGGDGEVGQKSKEHFNLIPANLITNDLYTIGEVIISRRSFLENFKDKTDYKVPRNTIAGLFNKDLPSELLEKANYIQYGYFNIEGEEIIDKSSQLFNLNRVNNYKLPNKTIYAEGLTEEFLNQLYLEWSKDYEIDGLVLDIDNVGLRKKLGRESNGNPCYARAYKGNWEEVKETIVEDIIVKISKHGSLKPVLVIPPTQLAGAMVTHVTAYNMKYLRDNEIGIKSKIKVKRSGDVIPKVIEVLEKQMVPSFMFCPICGTETVWNKTNVELTCPNDDCEGRNLSKIVDFFNILEIEEFGEPTIESLFNAGYNDVYKILYLRKEELVLVEGFGEVSADNLLSQFHKLVTKGIPYYKIAAASGCFQNLGEKSLINISPDYFLNSYEESVLLGEIKKIEGFSEIRAKAFIDGLTKFLVFIENLPIKIIWEQEKIEIQSDKYKNLNVVFTGFRDEDLEKSIIYGGGMIGSGVSSKTTHLVMAVKGSGTSKEKKAMELGIKIMTKEEFLSL